MSAPTPAVSRKHVLGVLAVVLVTLLVLHASRFWPDALDTLGAQRDDWLLKQLPAALKPFAVVIWAGLVFLVLSIAQSIVKRFAS